MNFEGKTALVTGAATLFFAERGADLVLADMNYEKLKDVKKRPKNRARIRYINGPIMYGRYCREEIFVYMFIYDLCGAEHKHRYSHRCFCG